MIHNWCVESELPVWINLNKTNENNRIFPKNREIFSHDTSELSYIYHAIRINGLPRNWLILTYKCFTNFDFKKKTWLHIFHLIRNGKKFSFIYIVQYLFSFNKKVICWLIFCALVFFNWRFQKYRPCTQKFLVYKIL